MPGLRFGGSPPGGVLLNFLMRGGSQSGQDRPLYTLMSPNRHQPSSIGASLDSGGCVMCVPYIVFNGYIWIPD